MKQEIIQYFKDFIYSSSSLRKRILSAPKEYIDYCNKLLQETPEWQKISFLIIGLCKGQTLLHCKECGKVLTYHKIACKNVFCSRKCANSNSENLEHKKQYNLQKYGSTVYCNSKTFKTKLLSDQGIVNVSQTEKYKRTRSDNAYQRLSRWNKWVIPLFSKDEFYQKEYLTQLKWQCVKCGNIFYSHIHFTKHISKQPKYAKIPRCLHCYPYDETNGKSLMEKELLQYCKQYFSNILENDRNIIKPYELDIYIPEIKLAIEFNGCYHHSLEAGSQLGYHLMKTEMCEQQRIRLIHIWEDEWLVNKETIKTRLLQVFTNQEQIDYTKVLDRCWYPLKQVSKYNIIVNKPEIVLRNNFHCENCGTIQYVIK